ncbi:MAG: hypothetical protein M1813_007987 [Trichoglossum hirsutum]|nr:MAG: hypothetical protein M1813_007987 [Trichoglossum hirsutum]
MADNSYSGEDDDEYFIPLQDQRVFGAGLKRKRVQFVPATRDGVDASPPVATLETPSIRDYYLSVVLPQSKDKETNTNPPSCSNSEQQAATICPSCHLPLPPTPQKPHESTLPHQVSLPHSHPPSSLPREHIGLQYLCAHGWDPDSRAGLGANGEGVRYPVKVKWKGDTVGLGVKVSGVGRGAVADKGKVKKLGAKEVRKREEEQRRKGERLREQFYASVDVETYLRAG